MLLITLFYILPLSQPQQQSLIKLVHHGEWVDLTSLKVPENLYVSCSSRNKKQPRRWFGNVRIDNTIIRETPNLSSLIFTLLLRYLDMISRELNKLEHMAEKENILQIKEEERGHWDHILRKLSLRR